MTSLTFEPTVVHSDRVASSSRPVFHSRMLDTREYAVMDRAFRLRAAVFAGELSWVPYPPMGREWDRCDRQAQHVGLFVAGGLVGYARILVPPTPFMLECEFVALLNGAPLVYEPENTFEVSRFAIHSAWRGRRDASGHSGADHLGRTITLWARRAERTIWLSVCEARHVRARCSRGFPFERFGTAVEYQPGVHACAARLDLATTGPSERSRQELAWYTTDPHVIDSSIALGDVV